MAIDLLYQRYCSLCDRGRTKDAELALDALGKAALECARQFARLRHGQGIDEDIAAEASCQFTRLATLRRYLTMHEGLLKTIVNARAKDAYRQRRKQCSLDDVPEELFKTFEKGFTTLEFCLTIGLSVAGNDPMSQLNRALFHTTGRELAMLLHKAEREAPELFPYLINHPHVANRLAHDRRIVDGLERLRAGKVDPNTLKQWDFQLRNRIRTADHTLN
jgi:hypothetical protein